MEYKSITLNIPLDTWEISSAGFFRNHPIPREPVLDDDGTPTEKTVPIYTDLQQVVSVLCNYFENESENGLNKLLIEGVVYDRSKIAQIKQDNINANAG